MIKKIAGLILVLALVFSCSLGFTEEWTNIDDYFKEAEKRQDELVKKANEYHKNREQLDGKVTFL